MQRLWLCATNLQLHAAPLAGVPFLAMCLRANQLELSNKHRQMVLDADATINRLTAEPGELAGELPGAAVPGGVIMLLRIGSGDEPMARTSRMEPEIEIIEA